MEDGLQPPRGRKKEGQDECVWSGPTTFDHDPTRRLGFRVLGFRV